jgi:molybdate transport system substrate-binding protein
MYHSAAIPRASSSCFSALLHLRDTITVRHAGAAGEAAGPGALRPMRLLLVSLAPALLIAACRSGGESRESPGDVRVAVASNFKEAHEELARRFEAESGYRIRASTGSTGQLFAQIRNGAPFDVFLAADSERPRLLEETGLAVQGSRFTYALGRLVLFGPGLDSVRSGGEDLREERFTHLAIANPRTAPYGAAAEEVLARLWTARSPGRQVVQGENIAHAHGFVRSGAAELGLVALSQMIHEPPRSYWLVPSHLHAPIHQDAVLLRRGENSRAAIAYLEFLRGREARRLIAEFGYDALAPTLSE